MPGLELPWNRPWARVIDGLLVGQLKAMSTVGVALSTLIRVTTQSECGVSANAAAKPGLALVVHVAAPTSILRHIFSEAVVEELLVTVADTGPGPSLMNEKVRAVARGSLCLSTIMSLKVMVAVFSLWVGLGEAVGFGVPVGLAVDVADAPLVGVLEAVAVGVAVASLAMRVPVAVGDEPPLPDASHRTPATHKSSTQINPRAMDTFRHVLSFTRSSSRAVESSPVGR